MENNKQLIAPAEKCSRCKYINAFICEHDKPVRDSFKLVNDPETNRSRIKYEERPLPPESRQVKSENKALSVTKRRKETSPAPVPTPEPKGGCCTIL